VIAEVEAFTLGVHTSKSGGRADGSTVLLSKAWWARYKACDDPGPVTHADVLCAHNCVDTHHNCSVEASRRCFMDLPRPVYFRLTEQFCYGDGPAYQLPAAQLIECPKCKQTHKAEARALQDERDEIRRLDSTEISEGGIWYIVDANWLKHWREYCWDSIRPDPPGPVSNWRLLAPSKMPRQHLQRATDYRGVNEKVWQVFVERYGGGPPICRAKLDIYAPPVPPPDLSAPSRRR